MKIYTKTGDQGTTGLFGGPRVGKDDPRICSYGTIDELNAVLGMTRNVPLSSQHDTFLQCIQVELFAIGAELATPNPEMHGVKWSSSSAVARMEQWIDQLEEELEPLRNFILPGGSPSAAHLHFARTVCRRAEREVVALSRDPRISDLSDIIIYLNRLSDLLFVMARSANHRLGVSDVLWQNPRENAASKALMVE